MRYVDGHAIFRDGTKIPYRPPANTLDPRYATCAEHRVACDCREAEYAEDVAEYRAEWLDFRKALADVIAGHPACCCQCTACELARHVHLTHLSTGDHCND